MPFPLANEDHAFLAGATINHLRTAGGVYPVLDDEGHYTAEALVTLAEVEELAARIVVLPPDTDQPTGAGEEP